MYSIIQYRLANKVEIINKILNKVKTYISSEEKIENKPKINKQKIRYNKHGFPTYSPRIVKDSESNKKKFKY